MGRVIENTLPSGKERFMLETGGHFQRAYN